MWILEHQSDPSHLQSFTSSHPSSESQKHSPSTKHCKTSNLEEHGAIAPHRRHVQWQRRCMDRFTAWTVGVTLAVVQLINTRTTELGPNTHRTQSRHARSTLRNSTDRSRPILSESTRWRCSSRSCDPVSTSSSPSECAIVVCLIRATCCSMIIWTAAACDS